eukprot:m.248352 g.248352  ORF g.248352 m.248352 type:complete len:50 (+) comp40287_c0_seq28:390-539(+)
MALANAVELSFQLSCSRFAFIDSMHNKAASSKEDSNPRFPGHRSISELA